MGNTKTSITLAKVTLGPTVFYHGEKATDFIEVEVSYSKGGANYFSGGYSKRGYRVRAHVQTATGDGGISFLIGGGIGYSEFLEEVKMFSATKLNSLARDPHVKDIADRLTVQCQKAWDVKVELKEREAKAAV